MKYVHLCLAKVENENIFGLSSFPNKLFKAKKVEDSVNFFKFEISLK